jgi:hypothetical protein
MHERIGKKPPVLALLFDQPGIKLQPVKQFGIVKTGQ